MSIEELFHDLFEVSHTALPQLGMADDYLQNVPGGFGLYLERALFSGEEDIGENGFGCDGEVA